MTVLCAYATTRAALTRHVVRAGRGTEDGGYSCTVEVRGRRGAHTRTANAQWIVPHNRFLLLKYGSHLNVELVSSVSSVKYLYKYVQKGPDRAMVSVVSRRERAAAPTVPDATPAPRDEISEYEDARVVGSSSAAWRLFGFAMSGRFPAVLRLDIHMRDEGFVSYMEGVERETCEAGSPTSSLTAWLGYMRDQLRCGLSDLRDVHGVSKVDLRCFQLTYMQFPVYYIYDKKESSWRPRDRPPCRNDATVALLPDVAVNQQLYFLRVLLVQLTGAQLCVCACTRAVAAGCRCHRAGGQSGCNARTHQAPCVQHPRGFPQCAECMRSDDAAVNGTPEVPNLDSCTYEAFKYYPTTGGTPPPPPPAPVAVVTPRGRRDRARAAQPRPVAGPPAGGPAPATVVRRSRRVSRGRKWCHRCGELEARDPPRTQASV